MGTGPNDRGLSRKHIVEACEASLRRLRTDHIDLYQCHRHDREVALGEVVAAVDHLVRAPFLGRVERDRRRAHRGPAPGGDAPRSGQI